jgi:hypothetical protein
MHQERNEMSDAALPGPAREAASGELRLDRAEFAEGGQATRCAACSQALAGSYYEVDGRVVCAECHQRLLDAYQRRLAAGGFPRAALAGLGAAVVGAGIYLAVRSATGYEVGLISILVGYLVGKAVNWGSSGRGGWPYQALAVVLTYLAIVSTYIPLYLQAQAADPAHAPVAGAGVVGVVVKAVALVIAAAVVPFMGGVRIVGLIIIAIGLYEAWKLNRRPLLRVSGPHALGGGVTYGFGSASQALGAGRQPATGPDLPAPGGGVPVSDGAPPALVGPLPPPDAAPLPRGVGPADSAAPIRPR